MKLTDLDEDVLQHVMKFTDVRSLGRSAQVCARLMTLLTDFVKVCKALQAAVDDDYMWQQFALSAFNVAALPPAYESWRSYVRESYGVFRMPFAMRKFEMNPGGARAVEMDSEITVSCGYDKSCHVVSNATEEVLYTVSEVGILFNATSPRC